MIAILDYGVGNVKAIETVLKRQDIEVTLAKTRNDLLNCEKIILPGVGSFDWAMKALNESGLRNYLDQLVLEKKVPILGICVGMQMLALSSEEGSEKGLGYINGHVKKIDVNRINHKSKTRIPHLGWNSVQHKGHFLFKDIASDSRFYFLHSYYFEPEDSKHEVATSEYGGRFACSVGNGYIFGTQFHPEKSHLNGELLLKNFCLNS